jgi:hypothetical protein
LINDAVSLSRLRLGGEVTVMAKRTLSVSGGAPASKSLLFMMIAMTLGFCVVLGAALLTASRVIRSLRLRSGSDRSTVQTPLGEFRLEKAQQVGPGLPVYPQASLVVPGATGPVAVPKDNQPQVVSSIYHVNSSREFVVDWYGEHLSPEFVRQDAGPKSLPDAFHDSQISDDDVVFVGERGEQVRVVSLTADDTGTKITLLRSTKAAAQTQPTK